MNPLFIYLIMINIIGLTVMYVDKKKAVNGKYRIPEKNLWGVLLSAVLVVV